MREAMTALLTSRYSDEQARIKGLQISVLFCRLISCIGMLGVVAPGFNSLVRGTKLSEK